MNRALFSLIVSVSIISGCGTLDQHPLLYGSKQTFGVAISAGADADFSVGFKSHDFAYVPTTVVEKDSEYSAIASIRGCSIPSGERVVLDNSVIDRAKAMTAEGVGSDLLCSETVYKSKLPTYTEIAAALKAVRPSITKEEIDNFVTEFYSSTGSAGVASFGGIGGFNAQALLGGRAFAVGGNVEGEAGDSLVEGQNEGQASLQQSEFFRPQFGSPDGANQDSLSVFGSFAANSRGSAETNGVGVEFGKIFSAGVAAQKVADSLGAKAIAEGKLADAQKACFEAVGKRTYDDDDKQIEAISNCLKIK